MNLKTTLALLVLAGAGVLLWWYGGPQLPPQLDFTARQAAVSEQGTREFLETLKPERIARIEVQGSAGILELIRKPGGAWSLPGNWPLRDAEVNALVERLLSLRSRFRPQLIDDNKDLASMGLDRPTVTVKLTVGGEERTLSFGEKQADSSDNRFARDTYVRLDDKPEALRLPPGSIADLDKPRDYYQQRRLFKGERVAKEGSDGEKTERLAAQSVSVADKKPDGAHFTLQQRGSDWELTEPVRDRVESATRDALLSAVPDIWAESFVPLGAADVPSALGFLRPCHDVALAATDIFFATQGGLLARSGLFDPERTITVQYANGDTVHLQIGGVSGRRNKLVPAPPQQGMPPGMQQQRMRIVPEEYRYAKLQDNDRIFEIKADKLKDVFVALDALRDSRFARFNSGDARKVEIQHGGEDIVLEKDKDKWKILKPMSAVADDGKVTDLLSKLSDLQARDKDIIDKDDPKKYGFDKPTAVVKVAVEEEIKSGENKEKRTRTLTVRIGKHDADKKKLYVTIDDWPRINAVDDSLDALVQRSALAYRGKQMLDFNAADVARFDIDNQGKKITLERDKLDWRLASPVKAEADAAKIDQLLADLGHLEAAEFLAQAPKKDELGPQYGLDKPALTVRIEFADKKKPAQALHIGKARSGKEGYFARLADGGPVFAVNEPLHKELARDSLGYRPQILWQLLPEEIVALTVSKAGQKDYTLTRSEKDWKIGGPFEANALSEAVQKMTADLVAPKVESYTVHEAKDLAQYGLDKPALTVRIKTVLDKDDKVHTLSIGKAAKEAGLRYAKRASDAAIFTVSDALVRAADRTALDLLDTALLHLDPGQIERLHSQAGDKSLTVERSHAERGNEGTAWQVTKSPEGVFPADTEAVANASGLLADLCAQRFVDYGKSVDWAKYGLDKPTVRVAVGAGKTEHVIELGKQVERGSDACYARVDKGAGAAVLPPETARFLKRDYLDYVNRNLLKFDGETAAALKRRMGTSALEIVRSQTKPGSEEPGWDVVKPTEEKADDQTMQQLFEQLGKLRAERIAAYPAKDLKPFGLDAPAAILTIKLKSAGERGRVSAPSGSAPSEHTIKLGKTTGKSGERFALVDDGKTVAVLAGSLAERLVAAPLAFRDRTIARFAAADRLQLERGPRRAVFSKIEGSWKLTEPLQSEAEQDQLNDLAGSLARLRADALVIELADPADLKKYGLDRPEATWRVREGDKDVLTLLIGNKEPKGERRYARQAKSRLVFLLDPRLSQKALDEYRPRTLWTPPLDAVEIESLNYRYRRNPFLLEKVGGMAWQAVGKTDAKINAATVEDTLAVLAGLKLSRYAVDKGANLALFGLDKPELILEVATRSGKRVLQIGNVEGNSKGRYARLADSDRNDVFVLDEEPCVRFLRDLNAFGRPPARTTVQPAAR